MFKLPVILVAAVILASAPAFGMDTGGVEIKGNLNQNTSVKNAVNAAVGKGTKAGQSIGAIHGGTRIGGNVNQTTSVKNAVNAAVGKGAVACQQIGTIGDNPDCK